MRKLRHQGIRWFCQQRGFLSGHIIKQTYTHKSLVSPCENCRAWTTLLSRAFLHVLTWRRQLIFLEDVAEAPCRAQLLPPNLIVLCCHPGPRRPAPVPSMKLLFLFVSPLLLQPLVFRAVPQGTFPASVSGLPLGVARKVVEAWRGGLSGDWLPSFLFSTGGCTNLYISCSVLVLWLVILATTQVDRVMPILCVSKPKLGEMTRKSSHLNSGH